MAWRIFNLAKEPNGLYGPWKKFLKVNLTIYPDEYNTIHSLQIQDHFHTDISSHIKHACSPGKRILRSIF